MFFCCCCCCCFLLKITLLLSLQYHLLRLLMAIFNDFILNFTKNNLFCGVQKKKLGRFFQFLQFHLLCSLWFEFLSCFCFLCFYFSMLVSYKFRLSSYILFGIDVSCTELINSSKISRSTNKIKTLIIVGPEPIWFFRFF